MRKPFIYNERFDSNYIINTSSLQILFVHRTVNEPTDWYSDNVFFLRFLVTPQGITKHQNAGRSEMCLYYTTCMKRCHRELIIALEKLIAVCSQCLNRALHLLRQIEHTSIIAPSSEVDVRRIFFPLWGF